MLLSFSPSLLAGQEIRLANASFEGEPSDATMPQQWNGCQRGSTPDILPGFWGVYLEPFEGESYIGLITREDGSFESIGQKLSTPFRKDECYRFTAELAQCSKDQLLAETASIKHLDWKTYPLQFVAEDNFPYIIIEAYYAKGIYFPYKGNLLIDNISIFKLCPGV